MKLLSVAKLVLKQSVKAHGPLVLSFFFFFFFVFCLFFFFFLTFWKKWDFVQIFFAFVNLGLYRNFQNANPTNHSWKFLNFSWIFFPMVHTKLCWDFWNVKNWNFNHFFFFFVYMGPNGNENFKTVLLQIVAKIFETFCEFFLPLVLIILYFGIFLNFEFPSFSNFFSPKFRIYHCCLGKD